MLIDIKGQLLGMQQRNQKDETLEYLSSIEFRVRIHSYRCDLISSFLIVSSA